MYLTPMLTLQFVMVTVIFFMTCVAPLGPTTHGLGTGNHGPEIRRGTKPPGVVKSRATASYHLSPRKESKVTIAQNLENEQSLVWALQQK